MTDQKSLRSSDSNHNFEQDEALGAFISSQTVEGVLVTFTIVGYNQENYICEAIEGAFAQTYEPLEIILSDDCSTDRTFMIMQEMANKYRGSKKIVTRQTDGNVGTILHVADVASIAKGGLIILAAGDDISKKERVEKIVAEWILTGAWGFYSKFDRIDEDGIMISESEDPRNFFPPEYRLHHYFANPLPKIEITHGATSAYDMRVFKFLDLKRTDYILSEDGVLTVLLNILGKEIKMINESLISYRENEQSLTNSVNNRKISPKVILNDEFKIERFMRSHANRLELFIRFNNKFGMKYRPLDTEQILIDLIKLRMRENWWKVGVREKFTYLKNNFSVSELKWALPRMLPKSFFIWAKSYIKRII